MGTRQTPLLAALPVTMFPFSSTVVTHLLKPLSGASLQPGSGGGLGCRAITPVVVLIANLCRTRRCTKELPWVRCKSSRVSTRGTWRSADFESRQDPVLEVLEETEPRLNIIRSRCCVIICKPPRISLRHAEENDRY